MFSRDFLRGGFTTAALFCFFSGGLCYLGVYDFRVLNKDQVFHMVFKSAGFFHGLHGF